jgi:nucleotide-binding universal stress UspA family protein
MPDALSHLLVPTDFGPASRRAARLALEMALGSGARVTLLYVLPEHPLSGLDAIGYLHRVLWTSAGLRAYVARLPYGETWARQMLDRQVHPEWRQTLPVRTAVRRGAVAAEVARYARDEGVDLIVLGVDRAGQRFSLVPRRSGEILRLADRPAVVVHLARRRPAPGLAPEPA